MLITSRLLYTAAVVANVSFLVFSGLFVICTLSCALLVASQVFIEDRFIGPVSPVVLFDLPLMVTADALNLMGWHKAEFKNGNQSNTPKNQKGEKVNQNRGQDAAQKAQLAGKQKAQ